jgi:hypothetical protein
MVSTALNDTSQHPPQAARNEGVSGSNPLVGSRNAHEMGVFAFYSGVVEFGAHGHVPDMSPISSFNRAPRGREDTQPFPTVRPPSGHVFCVQRQSGLVWYAKYRTGTGRQIQKKLGPAWTRRGRPPAGSFTRPVAEQWLCATLDQIRARTMPPDAGTRARFDDAAAEWLRYVEHDRRRKPTTVRGYRIMLDVHVLPEFGGMLLTDVTTEQIERWAWGIDCAATTRLKLIVCLSGIYHRARRVWGVTYDPVDEVQRPPIKRS